MEMEDFNYNKRLFLLIYDVQDLNNKNSYHSIKELKEFLNEEEAINYHRNKMEQIHDNSEILNFKSNGGSIIDLNDCIKQQGYSYEIIKQ